MILSVTVIISSNIISQLIFAIMKNFVFSEVRTKYLYTIQTSFGFKALKESDTV